ncbi:sulfurtransferase [Streptomyces sp. NPDC057909]|uniref:sulfurtransferase n=1 Tax=Streptomyces sp. NPDC057909 TaxID=3346277 RepID=UPI0036E907EC
MAPPWWRTTNGVFAPPERLREHYENIGVAPDTDVIVRCGSRVTACHDLPAPERAGIGSAALYPASWSAWSADPTRPVATGDEELPSGRRC